MVVGRAWGSSALSTDAAAGQEDETTAHVLRHTFGTHLVRSPDGRPGADLVLVAELMGHARLETARAHTRRPRSIA